MIVTIKHSARLDKLHPENWKKSKRFKQNKFDPPLNRKIGEKVAKRAIHKLFETGFNKIKYIYSSPLTRCIQTALIIQKEIKKKFNQDIKIRIEYGLTELEIDKPIFKNDKFNYSNKNYLDSELELDNIIKNYGDYFDTSYKSIIDFSEIKLEISELPFYTRSIKVYQKIKSQIKNENTIICGDLYSHNNALYCLTRFRISNYIEVLYGSVQLYKQNELNSRKSNRFKWIEIRDLKL